jgi:hypothetical protein
MDLRSDRNASEVRRIASIGYGRGGVRSGRLAIVKRAPRPTLITTAERSQEQQLRSREVRYVLMMGLRIGCLILAGVLVTLKVPLLGLWVSLCVAGMVLLPWLAVILANDGPPKPEHRLANRLHRAEPTPASNALGDGETREPRVIDAEP